MPRLWADRLVAPPVGSVEIDWTHWMARGLVGCWLLNEGAGAPTDLVRRRRLTTVGGSTRWNAGPMGVTPLFPATDAYYILGTDTQLGLPTARATVLVRRRKTDTTLRAASLFGSGSTTEGQRLGAHVPYSDGAVYWDFKDFASNDRLTWPAAGGYAVSVAPETWAFVAGTAGSAIYFNGQSKVSQGTAVSARANDGSNFYLNSGQGATINPDLQEISFFMILDAEWTAEQVAEWHRAPYAFLRPVLRRHYVLLAAAAVTGTGAVTFAGSTLDATGTEAFSGTGAVTFAVSALAATGAKVLAGTGSVAPPVSTIAASGLEVFTGTGAVTLPVSTLAGTGAAAFTGTAAVTLPVSAIAATGAEVFTGTGAVTFAGSTLAATGTNTPPAITGTAAVTFPVSTLASTGNVVSAGFAGSADVTFGVSAIAATGLEVFTGSASIAPPVSALAGAGTALLAITGTGSITLPVSDVAATGQVVVAITGTGAVSFPVSQINGVGNNGAVTVVGGGGFGGSIYLKTPIPALPEVLVEVPTIRGRAAVSFPVSQIQGTGVVAAVGAGAVRRRVSAIRGQGAVSLAGFGAVVGQRVSQVRGSGQVLLRDDATFSLELEDLDLELA